VAAEGVGETEERWNATTKPLRDDYRGSRVGWKAEPLQEYLKHKIAGYGGKAQRNSEWQGNRI